MHLQTTLPSEIIISEDGDSNEMKQFLAGYDFPTPYQHLSQADEGWRKNTALNKAIKNSKFEYLIFIDEDCLLHPLFIENHLKFAEAKAVLAGKRVKLGPDITNQLITKGVYWLKNNYPLKYFKLKKDSVKFFEEGITYPENSFTKFIVNKFGISAIKGCNFSLHKEAMYAINGFDEDYLKPAVGEDYDLGWRLEGLGYQIKSIKHFAVQYHLNHKESWNSQEENLAILKSKQAKKEYRCKNGLIKE